MIGDTFTPPEFSSPIYRKDLDYSYPDIPDCLEISATGGEGDLSYTLESGDPDSAANLFTIEDPSIGMITCKENTGLADVTTVTFTVKVIDSNSHADSSAVTFDLP